MADKRNPYPLFNAFRSFVMKELTRRKLTYPTSPVSSFVRLTSCMADDKIGYVFFTLGLHGFDADSLNIFDVTYGNKRDIVGYAYDINNRNSDGTMKKMLISADQLTAAPLTSADLQAINPAAHTIVQRDQSDLVTQQNTLFAGGTHPIPGITSVDITRRGLGTPQIAKVTWKCYNRAQLEFLRNHFLLTGGHVVLEWGNQFANKKLSNVLDFSNDQSVRQTLVQSINSGRKYIITNWVEPNDGNYDFLVGAVGNFSIDFEAETNIITCTTDIYSVGEQMWGLNTHMTYVNKDSNSIDERLQSTINDFFAIGSNFDKLVHQNSNDSALVAVNYSNWSRSSEKDNASVDDLKNFSSNPDDYNFISWTFFVNTVIPQMFALIDDDHIKQDINNFTRFYTTDDEWIGNNVYFRSTDPDTMLIVQSDMKSTPTVFLGAGKFDQFNNQTDHTRGKLDRGVWLNTGMVRACFLGANSFMEGLRAILMRMNDASAQFWQLQIFWDDEINRYRIIDAKYQSKAADQPAFYKFNVGGAGELLNLNLESAFPPALISQMALFAKFKTESFAKKQELLKNYPSIGTTSTFIFSLNWTNLRDVLDLDLQNLKTSDGTPKPIKDVLGTSDPEVTNPTNRSRVNPSAAGAVSSVVSAGEKPSSGQPVASTSPTNTTQQGLDGTQIKAGALRNNPFPIKPDVLNVKTLAEPTSRNLSLLDPSFRTNLQRVLDRIQFEKGHEVIVYETYRSQERQNYLYEIGRNGNPGPPVTKTKHSRHTVGLACDIIVKNSAGKVITDSFYPTLVQLCKEEGVDTIGDWDAGHIQNAGPATTDAVNKIQGADATTEEGINQAAEEQQIAQTQELENKAQGIITRFGWDLIGMVELQPSAMVARITRYGFEHYPEPNGFVTGFPTTTGVTVDTLGIAGLSVSDGFFVDKIPFIFERHGVFQITEITERINDSGWVSSVRGYFKLVWLEGSGPDQKPIEMFVG